MNFCKIAAFVLVLAPFALAGPDTVVDFKNVRIDDRPAHLQLDTGSFSTILFSSGARRLRINFKWPSTDIADQMPKGGVNTGLTDPAHVVVGGQKFTAPLSVFAPPFLVSMGLRYDGLDGLIGWPQVRDNILVFDSAARVVRSADKLPAGVSGWLKLKIQPAPVLLVDIPIRDGGAEFMLIDTGSPFGVGLPASRWNDWHAAHPGSEVITESFYTPGVGGVQCGEAWADQIHIGPLAINDVAVRSMSDEETAGLDHFAGALGMYALSRLDLVVDGKNGFAYLRPKDSPGAAYPGISRPGEKDDPKSGSGGNENWTVADNVHLSIDDLYLSSAEFKFLSSDIAGALADCDKALELNGKSGETRGVRGTVRQAMGDFRGAIADYDAVIARATDDADDAMYYTRLYRRALQMRLGAGAPDFAGNVERWKNGWAKTLGRYLAGEVGETAVMAAVQSSDEEPVEVQRCEAFYFVGMKDWIDGDPAAAASNWQRALDTRQSANNEYQFARMELARVRGGGSGSR
jgi:tetratricopeptide (TPR) repeat protein